MNWEAISRIYEAVIGKVVVLFSVVSILTIVTPIKLILEGVNTSISLLGAIIITISYVLYKVFVPSLVVYFKSSHDYTSSIIEQNKENHLDTYVEFEVIERPENIELIRRLTKNDPSFPKDEIKVLDIVQRLEQSRAIKTLSVLKYDITIKENWSCRWAITLLFAAGILMMYWPSIVRIVSTIAGGFK